MRARGHNSLQGDRDDTAAADFVVVFSHTAEQHNSACASAPSGVSTTRLSRIPLSVRSDLSSHFAWQLIGAKTGILSSATAWSTNSFIMNFV